MKGRVTRDAARRAAELWLGVLSLLVPAPVRDAWLEEWRGELRARMGAARDRGERRRIALRTAGALVDAWYLRREGTTMEWWTQDVRFALRGLRSRPAFTAVAVGTLALAVGANTALFSVIRGVLLRPLPYEEADRLVRVESRWVEGGGSGGPVSYPNMRDLAVEAADALAGVAALDEWQPVLTDGDRVVVLHGATVTAGFFDLLGVEPAAGRFFSPDEEGEGREQVVVLGHALWRDRFAADPGVIGRPLDLSGNSYTVIGVVGPGFEDPQLHGDGWEDPQVWRTPWFEPAERPRSGRSWAALARLGPGVDLERARARVEAVYASLSERYPEDNRTGPSRWCPWANPSWPRPGRPFSSSSAPWDSSSWSRAPTSRPS